MSDFNQNTVVCDSVVTVDIVHPQCKLTVDNNSPPLFMEKESVIYPIMDTIEDFLDKYNITIPCEEYEQEDRDETEDAGRLFGERYYELEDGISEVLRSYGLLTEN